MKHTYHLLLKAIVVLNSCLFFSSNGYSQLNYTQSFDTTTFPPNGWTIVGATGWARATTLQTGLKGAPHSGAGMASVSYPRRGGTAALTTSTLCSPRFPLSGRGSNTPTVSFWLFRDSLSKTIYDTLSVYMNTTASLTGAVEIGVVARSREINLPDTVTSNGWYQYSLTIPAQFAKDTNYVLFSGTNMKPATGATSGAIYLDDVNITEYPPLCLGTPTAGTIVASDTTLCNGKGQTPLNLVGATIGTGITYSWYASASAAGPWQSFGTNVPSLISDTLTTTTYFQATIACQSSNLFSTTPPIAVKVNPNPNPIITITSSSRDTICKGDTLSLTASGAVNYVWSITGTPSYNTNATIRVSPVAITTYSVVGTDTYGCKSTTATQAVGVGTPPTLTLTNSNPAICLGGTSTLTVKATTTGAYGLTYTYNWTPGVLSSTTTATVTPTSTTLYTVTVIGQDGCSATDTSTVKVNSNATNPVVTISPASATYCSGALPISLHANSSVGGTLTYSWKASTGITPTSTIDSLSVSGITASTTYSVIITDTSGCQGTGTASITYHPTPTGTIKPSSRTICQNGNVILNLTVGNTGGPSTGYTEVWTPSGQTGTQVIVNPTDTTIYSVTITSPYGCSVTDTVKINVNKALTGPSISINSNSSSFCSATPVAIVLNAVSDSTGLTYAWTPAPTTPTITNDTANFNPTKTTAYTVVATSKAGCTSSAVTTITVNPTPTIRVTPTSSNICAGNLAQVIPTSTTGGLTYSWAPVIGYGVTGDTLKFIPASTNTYTVTGTSLAGCASTATATITVNQPPLVTFSDTISTNTYTVQFADTAKAGISKYAWKFGDGVGVSSVQNPTYTYSNPGVYTVTLIETNTSGCVDSLTQSIDVSPISTGIASISTIEQISIVPNPSASLFTIQFSATESSAQLKVLNVLGSELFSQWVAAKSTNATTGVYNEKIDLSEFPSGVYFVVLSTTNSQVVKRVIKQ